MLGSYSLSKTVYQHLGYQQRLQLKILVTLEDFIRRIFKKDCGRLFIH